ncbi:MAG: hypothetical protein HKN72_13350 [Gemmatimonadetes bacterium]|nr:hypothetical protein [Gemmatimonadota bacterium]
MMRAWLSLAAILVVFTLPWPTGAEAASLGEDGVGSVYDDDLIEAARDGDVHAVRELLAGGANPDATSGDGMTALHWAAERNQPGVAAVLLDAGATVDPGTRIGGYTPLHLASRRGHVEMVRALLEAGADVRATTTNSGVTALHLAAAAVHGTASVKSLLRAGAEPNVVEATFGQTPLMFASGADRAESVRALLAAGADPSMATKVVDVLQHVIADDGASRVLNDALNELRKADGGGPDWEPSAAQARQAVETQRAYLASGEAYREYDPDELISHRPDYPGGPDVARRPYRETLVGFTGGMTALLHAAREGHIEAAMALLDGGADIDQPSADNTSPLLIATLNGQFDLALRLTERGADPDLAASTDGATPLFAVLNTHWAPKSNYPQPRAQDNQRAEYMEVLEAILAAGADPNPRLNTHLWYWEYGLTKIGTDLRGATPFWRAAYAQDVGAMKLLVAHGADPDIPTMWPEPGMRERRQQDGRQQEDSRLPTIPTGAFNAYPLHVAAGGGYTGLGAFSVRNVPNAFIPSVKYLIEDLGADVDLRDSWGYTALHYAAARGDNDLIRYLVSQGADVTVISRLGQSTADLARGGRSGFFTRVAYPETVALLQSLGSSLECLHTHFLDTGDSCPLAGVDDPWAPRTEEEEDRSGQAGRDDARRENPGEELLGR